MMGSMLCTADALSCALTDIANGNNDSNNDDDDNNDDNDG